MRTFIYFIMTVGFGSMAHAGAGDTATVYIRGEGHVAQRVDVVAVSSAGLALRHAPEQPVRLLGWDLVKGVEGPAAVSAAPFLALGETLMRARTRLERGDVWLADSALDVLKSDPASTHWGGPTGLLLAECELRSALDRKAPAAATIAWLKWSAVERTRPRTSGQPLQVPVAESVWVGGACELASVIDGPSGLCPALPPIYPRHGNESLGTLRLLNVSPQLKDMCGEGSAVRNLANAYALAARIAGGGIKPDETVTMPVPSGDAEQLVIDMVAAQTAPGDGMRSARARLVRRLEALERDNVTRDSAEDSPALIDRTWQRGWLHAAIGRSLLAEDEPALKRQGLVELLCVPALDDQTHPALSATVLIDVIDYLQREDPAAYAVAINTLSQELVNRFGGSPPKPSNPPAGPVQRPHPVQEPVSSPSNQTPLAQPSKEVP